MNTRRKSVIGIAIGIFIIFIGMTGFCVWHYQKEKQLYRNSINEAENGNIAAAEGIVLRHKSQQSELLATDLDALIKKNQVNNFLAINEWAIKESIHPESKVINKYVNRYGFFNNANVHEINIVTVYHDAIYDKIAKNYVINSDAIYKGAKEELLHVAKLFDGPSLYGVNLDSLFVLDDICMDSDYSNTENTSFKRLVLDVNNLKTHYITAIGEANNSINKLKSDKPSYIPVFEVNGSQSNKMSFYMNADIPNGGNTENQIFLASRNLSSQHDFYIILRPSEYRKYKNINGLQGMTYYTGHKKSTEYITIVSQDCNFGNCVKNSKIHKAYVIDRLRLAGRENNLKAKYHAEMKIYSTKMKKLKEELLFARALGCPYVSSGNKLSSLCSSMSTEANPGYMNYSSVYSNELKYEAKKIASDTLPIVDKSRRGAKIKLIYAYPVSGYFYTGQNHKVCNSRPEIKNFQGFRFYNKINKSTGSQTSYDKWLQYIIVKHVYYPIRIPQKGHVAACGAYNNLNQMFRTWIIHIKDVGVLFITASTSSMQNYSTVEVYRLINTSIYKVMTFRGSIDLGFTPDALVLQGTVVAPGMARAQGTESAVVSLVWNKSKGIFVPAYTKSSVNRLLYLSLNVKYTHKKIKPASMAKVSGLLAGHSNSEVKNINEFSVAQEGSTNAIIETQKKKSVSFKSLNDQLTMLTKRIDNIYSNEISNFSKAKSNELKNSEIKWIVKNVLNVALIVVILSLIKKAP